MTNNDSRAGPGTSTATATSTAGDDDRLSSYLESIPDELFINIASRLDLPSLMNLETNHELLSRVNTLGIPTYLIHHPTFHMTLHPPQAQWPPSQLVRYNHRISRQLSRRKWHAAQIGPAWGSAVIPVMELMDDRLLVGAGGRIIVHPLAPPAQGNSSWEMDEGSDQVNRGEGSRRNGDADADVDRDNDRDAGMIGGLSIADDGVRKGKERGPRVIQKETIYNVAKKQDGSRGDIIGLAPLADGQVIVAQFDGTIQRLSLGLGPNGGGVWRSTAHYSSANLRNGSHPTTQTPTTTSMASGSKSAINTMSHDGDSFMTTTSGPNPCAMIYSARSPWIEPNRLDLPGTEARAWSSLITTTSKYLGPSIVLGLSSKIAIYDLDPHHHHHHHHQHPHPNDKPSRTLTGPDPPSRSSAYDIKLPPLGSGHHPSLLLSAWYDSHLRLHDLRSPTPEAVLEFSDPWSWADGSAMYSCAWVGEHGIAGGGARHGTVCLFDIRKSESKAGGKGKGNRKTRTRSDNDKAGAGGAGGGGGGWSIFTPGGKGSPVYSLRGEGGRLWGVTEKRAFVLAFDGSGDHSNGILSHESMLDLKREGQREKDRVAAAAAMTHGRGGGRGRGRGRHGYGYGDMRGRTSDLGWTANTDGDGDESLPALRSTGYQHSYKSVDLFESLPLA